jgi:IstB-like ATP binding protein
MLGVTFDDLLRLVPVVFHATQEQNLPGIVDRGRLLRLGEWDRIFKNPMTTAAAIDRLVHHSAILEFSGRSKRADEAESRSKILAPEANP